MKYIDVDKIRDEIEQRRGYISVAHFAEDLLSFIDSNQRDLFEPSKEDMDALAWVITTGISTQPIPHHIHIKKLYKKLKDYYEIY